MLEQVWVATYLKGPDHLSDHMIDRHHRRNLTVNSGSKWAQIFFSQFFKKNFEIFLMIFMRRWSGPTYGSHYNESSKTIFFELQLAPSIIIQAAWSKMFPKQNFYFFLLSNFFFEHTVQNQFLFKKRRYNFCLPAYSFQ